MEQIIKQKVQEIRTRTGKKLRKRRREIEMSQTQLAKMIGLSQNAVWCWEAGRNSIQEKYRAELCNALRVPEDYFD